MHISTFGVLICSSKKHWSSRALFFAILFFFGALSRRFISKRSDWSIHLMTKSHHRNLGRHIDEVAVLSRLSYNSFCLSNIPKSLPINGQFVVDWRKKNAGFSTMYCTVLCLTQIFPSDSLFKTTASETAPLRPNFLC
jgi:hypothetical protein